MAAGGGAGGGGGRLMDGCAGTTCDADDLVLLMMRAAEQLEQLAAHHHQRRALRGAGWLPTCAAPAFTIRARIVTYVYVHVKTCARAHVFKNRGHGRADCGFRL